MLINSAQEMTGSMDVMRCNGTIGNQRDCGAFRASVSLALWQGRGAAADITGVFRNVSGAAVGYPNVFQAICSLPCGRAAQGD